jgi:UDP-glucose 4-epimerase
MNILVTGGAGFIASHIVDAYIELGHNVVVVDNLSTGSLDNLNPKAKFIEMDINSSDVEKIFINERIEVLNHHAAQMDVRFSVIDPKIDANINIIGGLNLYEAARKSCVKKIIFASSGGAIYGDEVAIPTPENSVLEPCSPYGIAKLANEKYLAFYKQTYNIDIVCLRYANIYGPRQNFKGEAGVVAIFIHKLLNGEQPVINGDGKNTRDYVFIKDVVNANVIALKNEVSGTYNLGTEIETNVNQIFNYLKELTGTDCAEVYGKAKSGEQRVSCISYQNFFKEHNWKPETKLIDGLKETSEYFKKRI